MNPIRARGRQRRSERERGQVLALFTLALVTTVAMVAVVVDGGNSWAQERQTQNGTDAAALAGTTVLAADLAGNPRTDGHVLAAVNGAASEMSIDIASAEYTDIDGNPLGVQVGASSTGLPPATARGVAVTGSRDYGTYFASAIGIPQLTATTEATAITGVVEPPGFGVLPVTPPINIVSCDGQNRPYFPLGETEWAAGELYKIPLCQSAPGNVGWLDWTPPSGGSSELAACIRDPYNTPGCNDGITVPSWNYVAQTGNTNSSQVQSALRQWDGHVVYIPLFDDTCNTDPGPPAASCPGGPGTGQQHWYHFVGVGAFQLCGPPADGLQSIPGCTTHGSYLTGNNRAECESGGNGATSCLVGQFVEAVYKDTTVGPLYDPDDLDFPSPTTFIGTQLIR